MVAKGAVGINGFFAIRADLCQRFSAVCAKTAVDIVYLSAISAGDAVAFALRTVFDCGDHVFDSGREVFAGFVDHGRRFVFHIAGKFASVRDIQKTSGYAERGQTEESAPKHIGSAVTAKRREEAEKPDRRKADTDAQQNTANDL